MRKITFLLALLCVSVMGFAVTPYCETVVQSTIENTSISVKVTIEKINATTTRVILDNEHITGLRTGGCFQSWNGVWKDGSNAPGVSDFANGWTQDGTKWQKDFEWDTYSTTANIYFLMNLDASTSEPHGAGFILTDIDMSTSCSSGGGGGDPDPDPEGIDWNSVSFVPGSTQYKVGALSASNLPNEVVNVQKPGWAEEQGIYMTFPSADQLSCSVDAAISGAGMVVYLSNFQSTEETAVTVNWNGGSRTFYVYNNNLMTLPATKAASPATAVSNVRAVYSQYALNTGMTRYGWSDGTTQNVIVDGRRFPSYQITNQLGLGIGRTNVSMMNKLHLDVWAESSFDINVCLISDGAGEHNQTVSLTGNQWNSVNLSLDDFQATKTAVTAIKLSGPSVQNQLFFLDNIYFYSETDLPDPDPTDVYDTNFALSSNGGIAYPSTNNGENFAARAIDGDNGTQWESVQGSDPQTWTVDLGQRRIFNVLQIRWEGAYARAFTISISNDASSWTQVAEETNYTTGGDNVEYQIELGENKTARYIRFNGTARATGYGYSFKEFRVLLTGTSVLTSVGIASEKELVKVGEYATLTASPKDQNNSPIAADLSYSVSPSDLGHVTDGKYYPDKYGLATITVTAEAGGVQVTNNVQIWGVTSTNLAKDNALSDGGTYTSDGGDNHLPAKAVDGLNDTWWQGSTNGESGAADDESRTYDAYFTIDLGGIYNLQLVRIIFDGACSDKYKLKVSANNSDWADAYTYDQVTGNHPHIKYISTADLNNSDNVRYIKFHSTKASTQWGVKIYEMEVYGTEASNMKTVSASVNPTSTGSVTVMAGDPLVAVTEVASGTLVTFTATPAEGYDFINWTQGGVEVSTNAEYVPTITSNTSLVANFELKRTPYCATPVSDTGGRTLFLTISKTENANEYKILFEGSEENRITNTNVYVGTVLRLRNVNGVAEYHFSNAEGIWHVSSDGFGSAYVTFTASDFRDISFVDKGVDLYRNMSYGTSGDLSSFNAFPDASLIKWDATCTDEEAPILAAPTATPLSGTSVRLAVSATDDMVALLTYNVNYKPEGDAGAGTDLEFNGTAGEVTYKNIKGLSAGVRYQFSVTVSDGTNTSAAQVCYAKPTMPTAPVPAHNANLVRSIYSDKYESALAHDFIKNNWNWIPYTQQSIGGDNFLVYTSNPEEQAQMPNVAWGDNNDGANAIIAKDGFNDGTNKGLDVREMQYIHFDMWSAVATIYPQIALNDDVLGFFRLNGTGWQSFDLPLSTLTEDKLNNIRWIAFGGFRDPNPEEIAIDNVYFWSYGTQTTPIMGGDAATGGWATFSSPVKVAVPSGLTAYKATYSNEGGDEQLVLDAVSGAIPANEGVLLRGEANHVYTFSPTNDAAGDYTGNALVGCPVRTDISSVAATNDIFCLRYSDIFQITGFYLYSGQYIAAGKAYLPLAKAEPSSAPRRIRFVFREEQGTTGFDPTNAEAVPTTKFIENGQLYIRRGDAVYTIQGVRVK